MDAKVLSGMSKTSLEAIVNFFVSIRSAKTPEELIRSLSALNETVFEGEDARLLYCGEPNGRRCSENGACEKSKDLHLEGDEDLYDSNPISENQDKKKVFPTSRTGNKFEESPERPSIEEIVKNAVALAAERGCLGECKKQDDLCLVSLTDNKQFSDSSDQMFNSLLPYISEAFYRFKSRENETRNSGETENIKLTPREKEVLTWVSRGKGGWEVGEIIGISERTVKFHLQNIYKKLDVINRAQAVTRAIQCNILEV